MYSDLGAASLLNTSIPQTKSVGIISLLHNVLTLRFLVKPGASTHHTTTTTTHARCPTINPRTDYSTGRLSASHGVNHALPVTALTGRPHLLQCPLTAVLRTGGKRRGGKHGQAENDGNSQPDEYLFLHVALLKILSVMTFIVDRYP